MNYTIKNWQKNKILKRKRGLEAYTDRDRDSWVCIFVLIHRVCVSVCVCVNINIYNYSQAYYLYEIIASFYIVGRLPEKMTDSRAWAGRAQGSLEHCISVLLLHTKLHKLSS